MDFIILFFWLAFAACITAGFRLACRLLARRRALATLQTMGLIVSSLATVRSTLTGGNGIWSFYVVARSDVAGERRAYVHVGHWLIGPLSSQVEVEWD